MEIESFKNENSKLMARSQFLIAAKIKNKCESIGTCVLMKLDNRYFLVTAAHVMNERHNVEDNALYLLLDAEPKKIAILIEEDIICYDCPNSQNIPDEHDIAVIELTRENYNAIPDENFLTLEQVFLDIESSEKAIYAISGYPNSQNNSFRLRNRKNKFLAVYTEKVKKNDFFTIFLSYHKTDFKESPPKPQGMSGGGIWIMSHSTNLTPQLIGISVCYEDKKYVKAVKIHYVLSLIKGFFKGTILDSIDLPFTHIEEEENCKLLVDDTTLRNYMLKEIMAEVSKQAAEVYFGTRAYE